MTLKQLFVRVLDAPHTQLEKESASFFVEREGDTLRILFEESNGRNDWINNFRFLALPKKPYKHMERVWFAHRGFNRVWKVIEPELAELVVDPSVRRIEIGGYSHGAAVAVLCYEYCRYHRNDIPVVGFGFGAPRVVWGVIPKEVRERLNGFVVIRNDHDIVTHLPPAWLGYRHVGRVCHIKRNGCRIKPVRDHYPGEYTTVLTQIDPQT